MLKPKSKVSQTLTRPKTIAPSFEERVYNAEGWSLSIDTQDGIPILRGSGDIRVITDGTVTSGQSLEDVLPKPHIVKKKDAEPNYGIGQAVEGKGIYHGTITLPPRHYITLPEMHLWVAPNDMSAITIKGDNIFSLGAADATIAQIDELSDHSIFVGSYNPKTNPWGRYGKRMYKFNDIRRHYESKLYDYLASLDETKPNSAWFIPTREILNGGLDEDGNVLCENNMFAHRDKLPEDSKYIDITKWSMMSPPYGSCTEASDHGKLYGVDLGTERAEERVYEERQRILFRPVALDLKL